MLHHFFGKNGVFLTFILEFNVLPTKKTLANFDYALTLKKSLGKIFHHMLATKTNM